MKNSGAAPELFRGRFIFDADDTFAGLLCNIILVYFVEAAIDATTTRFLYFYKL